MLDFSDAKTSEGVKQLQFKDLKVGEVFVLTDEIECGSINPDTQYVYIKTTDDYSLELNEESFECIGQSVSPHEDVTRVKVVVKSVSIID